MRIAFLAFAVLAVAATGSLARAADPELKIGLVGGLFRDRKPAVVRVVAKPLCALLAEHVGVDGEVEVVDGPAALADRLKDGKVQLGVFHGFEFAWAQQRCDDLIPLVIARPNGGVRAVLVVPADSRAKTTADLRDAAVRIPRGAKAHTLVFLDKLRDGLPDSTATPTPKTDQTPEEVLNAVAGGDSPAALVDAFALEGYKTLHPGGFDSLRVLARSEEFPPAVVCYRKGTLTDEQVGKIRDGMTASAKTPSGKLLMTLWNLKGFEAPPKGYQTSLDEILKAYPPPKADGTKTSGGGSGAKGSGGK